MLFHSHNTSHLLYRQSRLSIFFNTRTFTDHGSHACAYRSNSYEFSPHFQKSFFGALLKCSEEYWQMTEPMDQVSTYDIPVQTNALPIYIVNFAYQKSPRGSPNIFFHYLYQSKLLSPTLPTSIADSSSSSSSSTSRCASKNISCCFSSKFCIELLNVYMQEQEGETCK